MTTDIGWLVTYYSDRRHIINEQAVIGPERPSDERRSLCGVSGYSAIPDGLGLPTCKRCLKAHEKRNAK